MTFEEAEKNAKRHADMVAPKPTIDKTEAGFRGAAISIFAILAFSFFAGFDVEDFAKAYIATIMAAFGLPFLYFRQKENKHSKEYWKEFTRLFPVGKGP